MNFLRVRVHERLVFNFSSTHRFFNDRISYRYCWNVVMIAISDAFKQNVWLTISNWNRLAFFHLHQLLHLCRNAACTNQDEISGILWKVMMRTRCVHAATVTTRLSVQQELTQNDAVLYTVHACLSVLTRLKIKQFNERGFFVQQCESKYERPVDISLYLWFIEYQGNLSLAFKKILSYVRSPHGRKSTEANIEAVRQNCNVTLFLTNEINQDWLEKKNRERTFFNQR